MSGLTPILEVAREILETAGRKGMSAQQIAEAAVSQIKNMGLPVEDFRKKVQGALARNLKLKSSKPTFAPVNWDRGSRKGKPRQGWYRLKQTPSAPPPPPPPPPILPTGDGAPNPTAFLGKAGEYAVMSELLFWGFNPSIMTVDDGIDIVASKSSKFYHIQVKTATQQKDGKYLFTISRSSFAKYNAYNVFYVFVLRKNMENKFIIIPNIQIRIYVDQGIISGVQKLSLTIIENTKKHYILNGETDITMFYGDFGKIY
jgi:hypothetical protein